MNFNYSNKELREKINFLSKRGKDILQIIEPTTGSALFFLVDNFEPPQSNSVTSSPFLTFKGLEISDFLQSNVYNQALNDLFISSFQSLVEKEKAMLYKFSEKFIWTFYSA